MTERADDVIYMRRALALARAAGEADEVPVGAVLVRNGRVLAEGYNLRECAKCATRHAEMIAIEDGCRKAGGWRLTDTTLYVTLEPCPMCTGALLAAHIDRVVYGAPDPRAGGLGGAVDLASLPSQHRPEVTGGVLANECAALLGDYFRAKRAKGGKWEDFVM